jgi:predicted ATPase/class 3 adenylate cyclase
MKCPSCQATVPEGSKFCNQCGAALAPRCPSCGHETISGAKFCPECGTRLTTSHALASTTTAAAPSVTSTFISSAERRQLTVLFCDIVGSTTLATRLDPEDLREIIAAYRCCVAEAVSRLDGFVAQYMGDGALIYYGYPLAHEDDPERAVRTGLALIDAVGQLPGPERLQLRIGIGTGEVVVGDLMGSGEAQERGIIGETPNLAARLQALAEPNSVVIGPSTRRLLGDLFEYKDLGVTKVKGFREPVQVWRVLRPSAVESRFDALHAHAALVPLVGREEEIELLERRWRRVRTGNGQVVLLSGEPGIGKSRLSATLQERLQSEPHTRLRYFCSPYHTNSALYPFVSQLERAAAFERDEASETRLSKFEALLEPTSPPADDVSLLAELLALPATERFPPRELTPQQKKARTLEALLRQLERLARDQPVLMVCEDVHWIDPTSRELLDLTVEKVRHWPVFLLITFRPEFQPAWIGPPHVTTLMLSRLDRREGVALVEWIAGNKGLSAEIVSQIVDHTDGVPLFVEELTKAVLETSDSNAIGAVASAPLLAVPATLQASLMARLDHLGPAAKQAAQIGAAIGREFSYELIAAVAQRADAELRAALGQLVEAGLASIRGVPPQASYLFKHALVQDAAYGTLLRAPRQELHGSIAKALEERFPDTVEQQPEIMAHHCAQAGWVKKSIAYWGHAGRQALARSAMTEAAAQVHRGLELLAHLPEGPERWSQELDLQRVLAAALVASKGHAGPETGQAYDRARELCERLGDTAALIPVLGGLSTHYQARGEYAAMRRISEALLRLGERHDDTSALLVGSRATGLCLYHLGEFAAARPHLERVLDLYIPEVHDTLVTVTRFDVRTAALSYLSMTLSIQGKPGQAASISERALAVSRSLHNPFNRVFSLNYAAVSRLLRRVELAAEDLLDELLSLATELGFPLWSATANIMRGYVLAGRGEPGAGLTLARKGWAEWTATGSSYHGTYYLGLLAQTCERAGKTDEALALVDAALEMADRVGERWFEAELRRLKAEWLCVHYCGEREQGQACFDRAIAAAREQKARLWELRAATSLARLWCAEGKCDEARELLAPIYGWFTEGFDTPDPKEAKELLNELCGHGSGFPRHQGPNTSGLQTADGSA